MARKALWYLLPLGPVFVVAAPACPLSGLAMDLVFGRQQFEPGSYGPSMMRFFIGLILWGILFAVADRPFLRKPWWLVSPVNQSDTALGRYFQGAPMPSLSSLLGRYFFFGGLAFILILFGLIAVMIYPLAMAMLSLVAMLWLPFVPFSRTMREEYIKNILLPISLYGLIKSIVFLVAAFLLLLDVGRFVAPDFWDFLKRGIAASNKLPYFTVPDAVFGFCALLIVPVLVIRDWFWRTRQLRQFENLATSKAGSAALGLAEFRGRAMPVGDTTGPILSVRGSYFAIAFSENAEISISDEIRKPFYLEDDSGRILVDPADAKVWEGWASAIHHMKGVREISLRARTRIIDRNDTVLAELLPGDPVYVIGQVEHRTDLPADAADQPLHVVRPRQAQGFREALARTISGSRDINDVFFLTDSDERGAREVLQENRKRSLIVGLVWFALSAIVFANGAVWMSEHRDEISRFMRTLF